MFELLALLEAERLHDFCHAVARAEIPHEVVLEAHVEPRAARVTLAGAASAELAVDAAGFVALGPDHVKSAELGDALAEFDVRAAAGHIGRDRHRPAEPGARDDLGLLHVVFRVEDGVRDFLELEHPAEQLARLDARGADEHRLAAAVGFSDRLDGGVVFFAAGFENPVVLVRARDLLVRGDDVDVELVDVVELVDLSLGGAGHAREFFVEAEVVLDRDRGEGLGLAVDLDAFLRLDRLVQAVAPAAPRHFAAGERVHDHHLVFLDDILDVFFVEAVGFEELGDVVDAFRLCVAMLLAGRLRVGLACRVEGRVVFDVGELREQVGEHEGVRVVRVEVSPPQLRQVGVVLAFLDGEKQLLLELDERRLAVGVLVEFEFGLVGDLAHLRILHHAEERLVAGLAEFQLEERAAGLLGFSRLDLLLGLAGEPVAEHRLLADELFDERLEPVVLVGGDGCRTADNERGSGLVDEDRIYFVHDRKKVPALDLLLAAGGHAVVAEVVEAELAVGPVGDVALILGAAVFRRLVVLDHPHGEPEKRVELAHPLGVALGEVVVHRHHVNSSPAEGVEIDRERSHEGLAFAGRHFRDPATVQNHSAYELDIEVDHVPRERLVADRDPAPNEVLRCGFHHRKRLGKKRVQLRCQGLRVLDFRKSLLPLGGLGPEALVRQILEPRLELVDAADNRLQPADFPLVLRTDDFLEDPVEHDEQTNSASKAES